MSLIKKPSELTVKQTLTALIYAQPGSGKSTLACSAPHPVMFDFDNGVGRINGAHQVPTVQVSSWEEVTQALDEIKASPEYETIIIDTVGKMMTYMEDYIKRCDPKKKKQDGSLNLQGFGARKQMFIQFIKDVTITGRNIIFVAHEIEVKKGDETIIRPEVGGSSANDLIKELDLVGYMEMYGEKRMISFSPRDRFYAKNSCNLKPLYEIPNLLDENGNIIAENTFMTDIVKLYHQQLERNKEQTAEYEELVAVIKGNVAEIQNAADANNFVEWVKGLKHVYNSKVVAQNEIKRKAQELKLSLNKSTKKYSDAIA
jgi:phage nucleotide-binding protein